MEIEGKDTDGKYQIILGSSLDARINAIVEESGLGRGEVFLQAFAVYFLAYETAKSGGKVLLQTPVGKTYQTTEPINIGTKTYQTTELINIGTKT